LALADRRQYSAAYTLHTFVSINHELFCKVTVPFEAIERVLALRTDALIAVTELEIQKALRLGYVRYTSKEGALQKHARREQAPLLAEVLNTLHHTTTQM